MSEQRIFFSVGEPSGDLHAANLIRALRERAPTLNPVGFGGPLMAAAGCKLDCEMTDLAVMGLGQVLRQLPTFRRRLRMVREALEIHQPRAVVLIDYPGFNWWVARHAKELDIPVYYYGVPQMWGWAPWRVRKLKRLIDHVLCKLPFEPGWFQARGVKAVYVGHPYYDELYARKLDQDFVRSIQKPGTPLVTLLPGSRDQEVRATLPVMMDVMERVAAKISGVRFVCACFREEQAKFAREAFTASGSSVEIYSGRTPELIEAATCCLACSGSVSLELLFHRKPAVVLYRVNVMMYLLQHVLRTARYFTLVNLLAADSIERKPFELLTAVERDALPLPEFLVVRQSGEEIAKPLIDWLSNPVTYQRHLSALSDLRERFAIPGASQRAAEYIVESLGSMSISPPSPHWNRRATINRTDERRSDSRFPKR